MITIERNEQVNAVPLEQTEYYEIYQTLLPQNESYYVRVVHGWLEFRKDGSAHYFTDLRLLSPLVPAPTGTRIVIQNQGT